MQFMHEVGGLSGWQWLFLLEGIPAVILGIVVLFYLTDRPELAGWLTEEERTWLAARMAQEEKYRQDRHGLTLVNAFTDRREQVLIGGALQHVAERPGAQRVEEVVLLVVHREQHDGDVRAVALDLASRL